MPLDPKRLLVAAPLGRVDRVVARLSRVAGANPVLEADSLATALETLEGHPCDLVFWDAGSLPAADLERLLAMDGTPPVVAIVEDESAALELLTQGVAEVLVRDDSDGDAVVRAARMACARGMGGPRRFTRPAGDAAHDSREVSLQARVAAIQRMEAIGRLTAGMGHDFNNLLGVVIAHAGLLARTLPLESLDPEVAEGLEQIRTAAEAGRDLVSALLAYGRRSRIRPERLNVGRAVTDQLDLLRRGTRERVSIEVTAAADVEPSEIDADTLEQIMLNLVVNAQDAMPEGGRIRIDVTPVTVDERFHSPEVRVPPGRYNMVRVTDEGQGMDAPTLKRIYDPFFTTKGSDKRTGLGLAMAYGIMKQHAGYILTESSPAEGTSVRLLFPVAGEGLPADAAPEGSAPAGSSAGAGGRGGAGGPAGAGIRAPRHSGRRPRRGPNGSSEASSEPRVAAGGGVGVLYAEDNAPLRRAGRRVLESGGFVVFEAEDGQRALELFEEHEDEIEFVLSDLVMPQMGGAELYRRLSARRGDLRFILTSGHVDQALDMRDHLPNHVPYILKPWSPDELLETVGRVLSDDVYEEEE